MGEKIQSAAEPGISSIEFTKRIQELMETRGKQIEHSSGNQSEPNTETVLKLVRRHLKHKNVSKALRAITNYIGLVDITKDDKRDQLKSLYPRDFVRQNFREHFENDETLFNKVFNSNAFRFPRH